MKKKIIGFLILIVCLAGGFTFFTPRPEVSTRDQRIEALFTLSGIIYAADSIASESQKVELDKQGLARRPLKAETEGRYPIQQKVYDAVAAWPDTLRRECLQFLLDHPAYTMTYHAFVLESFGPPPKFKSTRYAYSMNRKIARNTRAKLEVLLRDVYEQLIQEPQWEDWKAEFKRHGFTDEEIAQTKKDTLNYIRWNPTWELEEFDPIVNPLINQGNGVGARPESDLLVYLIGPMPDRKQERVVLAHEFLHFPMNKVIKYSPELRAAFKNSEHLYQYAHDTPVYFNWRSYFLESFIRAASYRIVGDMPCWNTGFLYECHTFQALAQYEKNDMSIEQFLINLLNAYSDAVKQQ